jgi:hypothetical protein
VTAATTEYALSASVTATATGAGIATVQIGPNLPSETWHITNSAVTTTSAAVSRVKVYRGTVTPGNVVDGSNTGNLDASDTVYNLRAGDFLTVQWTGATPGAQCTFTVGGTRVVKGKRGY